MTLFRTFPDAEAACSVTLRNALIAGLDKRVYSSIPKNPTFPLIVVQRLGGIPAEEHALDAARIQLDVWGSAKGDATMIPKGTLHDIAQAARVVLHEMEGTDVSISGFSDEYGYLPDAPDAFVTGVRDATGVQWQPDPKNARERYVFSVTVFLH